jgi:hypothetical protein
VVRLGNFEMTFRIPMVEPISAKRCLTLTSVEACQLCRLKPAWVGPPCR